MTFPIDPIRRPQPSRKSKRAESESQDTGKTESTNLPAIIEPAVQAAAPEPVVGGHGVFAAQLLGQGGEKRGLRGGPTMIETANSSYNRAEWSGSKDRRTRVGKHTKTEI